MVRRMRGGGGNLGLEVIFGSILARLINIINIETFKYWPEGMHKQYAFKKYVNNEYKNCNILCKNVLSLPIYHLLTEEKINYVSDKIKEFYENDQ